MGAEFAPIDNDPFGRYSTEYDSQDLSPIRPTRTMHGGITVSPYSSRSPSGRKPNEAELVLVDQMKVRIDLIGPRFQGRYLYTYLRSSNRVGCFHVFLHGYREQKCRSQFTGSQF